MYAHTMIEYLLPVYIHPLGSDFLVEGINVLLRFYVSITRLTILRRSPHGLLCQTVLRQNIMTESALRTTRESTSGRLSASPTIQRKNVHISQAICMRKN
ncbi:hypothetical protein V8B97DRAFT_1963871 [Scleroderma yunnanense]